MNRFWGMAALAALYAIIVFLVPKPAAVAPEGWRLFALFVATVAGMILQPISGGALVLIAVTLSSLLGGLSFKQALDGYADPTVWLVLGAFFISRSMLNTGLARRIALFFVRMVGQTSLGVSYALCLSDLVLATIIPSNGARSGGVILPIVRSVAELYGSSPGVTGKRIGAFLMTSVYQGICVTTAMFLTGQSSNPMAAQLAAKFTGHAISWGDWFLAGIVPGLLSVLAIPWVVSRMEKPEVTHTPEASYFAQTELQKMGPVQKEEWILIAVFLAVCTAWATAPWTKLDFAASALLGVAALLVTGVLRWEQVRQEEAAWDMFIWFGGLVNLAKALGATGLPTVFAESVGAALAGWTWPVLFGVALAIYFYAHYAFASITAHLLAMYTAFAAVLTAQGAPPALVAYSFAIFTNFSAGLTHYGTTPAPMFFSQGYVDMKSWWRVGLVASFVNLAIWSTVGFGWWKLLGLW
ncbi:MAG: DASS family sodium-coupled anion symporter [Bryobacter sp.]|nr:DASS family sodium-coupled anion symporter [Bryobacter sp.]